MKHSVLLIAIWAGIGLAEAQVWCPPGATWYHDWFTLTETGFVHSVYGSDTLINGAPTQKLVATKHVYDFISQAYVVQPLPSLFTTVDQSLVSVWTMNGFDTLYWFSAVPGDSWQAPLAFDPVDVLVVDTGTAVVDAVALHYLLVEYQPGGWSDTLYERIGSTRVFMDASYSLGIDAPIGDLRCYQDQDLEYSAGNMPACDFILGSPDQTQLPNVLVFPSPGSDVFYIEASIGSVIEVTDAVGRRVAKVSDSVNHQSIQAEAWAPGFYTVSITNNDQRTVLTWQKH